MKASMGIFLAGIRLQWRLALVSPVDFILSTLLLPPFYTFTFLLIFKVTGKLESLVPFAIIGPSIVGMWATALNVSGEMIDNERAGGTLEMLVIAPHRALEIALIGRIMAVTAISLAAVPESMLVARVFFNLPIVIGQPVMFALALLGTALSIAAASLIMASTFVLSRSARLFQNLLSFPFYLLGGIAFPIEVLPFWLQPFSRAISLSWGGEALRRGLGSQPIAVESLLVLAGLTVCYAGVGRWLLSGIQRRIRANGSIGVS